MGIPFFLKLKAVATIMLATTTSTGIVSPIEFGLPFTYLMMPRPTNKYIAAAAAMLSSQPGKGYW
jgi:hypothetical protein